MNKNKLVNRFAHIIREADNLSLLQEEHALFFYVQRTALDKMVLMVEIEAPEEVLDDAIKTALSPQQIAEKVFQTQGYYEHLSRKEALQRQPGVASICMDCGKLIEGGEERFPDCDTNQVRCRECFLQEMETWMHGKPSDNNSNS